MTKSDKARELMARSKYKMSLVTALRRIRNGWSDEKIMNTPIQTKPPANHPLKKPCYKRMIDKRSKEHVRNGNT